MKIKLFILTLVLTISSFFSFGQDRHQDDRDRKPNHHGQYFARGHWDGIEITITTIEDSVGTTYVADGDFK